MKLKTRYGSEITCKGLFQLQKAAEKLGLTLEIGGAAICPQCGNSLPMDMFASGGFPTKTHRQGCPLRIEPRESYIED